MKYLKSFLTLYFYYVSLICIFTLINNGTKEFIAVLVMQAMFGFFIVAVLIGIFELLIKTVGIISGVLISLVMGFFFPVIVDEKIYFFTNLLFGVFTSVGYLIYFLLNKNKQANNNI